MVVQVVDSSFFFDVPSPDFVSFQTRILENDELKSTRVHRFGGPMSKCSFRTISPNSFKSLHLKKLVVSAKIHISWVVPLPRNSDQQDHYIFGTGFRSKPSFAKGATPDIHHVTIHFVQTLMAPPPAGTLHAHHHPQRHAGPDFKRETNSVFFHRTGIFLGFLFQKSTRWTD